VVPACPVELDPPFVEVGPGVLPIDNRWWRVPTAPERAVNRYASDLMTVGDVDDDEVPLLPVRLGVGEMGAVRLRADNSVRQDDHITRVTIGVHQVVVGAGAYESADAGRVEP